MNSIFMFWNKRIMPTNFVVVSSLPYLWSTNMNISIFLIRWYVPCTHVQYNGFLLEIQSTQTHYWFFLLIDSWYQGTNYISCFGCLLFFQEFDTIHTIHIKIDRSKSLLVQRSYIVKKLKPYHPPGVSNISTAPMGCTWLTPTRTMNGHERVRREKFYLP